VEVGEGDGAGGEEDVGGVDEGFVPEEGGEDGAEEDFVVFGLGGVGGDVVAVLVVGGGGVGGGLDGGGDEGGEEDPGEGLEG